MSLFWDERRIEHLEEKLDELQDAVLPAPPARLSYFESWLSQYIRKKVQDAIDEANLKTSQSTQALRSEAI